jgi:hypothetical protein
MSQRRCSGFEADANQQVLIGRYALGEKCDFAHGDQIADAG